MIISGCLPFTLTNSNIMSKVQESFETGKFRPGIEFSICSNQFHLPWKTAGKRWNWYQRWPWRNRRHISVWKIPTGKTGLPFQTYRCFRKFSTETTRKVVFHLLSNWISQKLFVNGKQPQFQSTINSNVMIRLFRTCSVSWYPLITWIIIFPSFITRVNNKFITTLTEDKEPWAYLIYGVSVWLSQFSYTYSKIPHIRTLNFRGQADR